MDYNTDSFCVLPFIHKHQRLSGDDTLCCFSQIPIKKENIVDIHTRLSNGEKIPHCKQCWDAESLNLESHRQRENKRWLSDKEVNAYIQSYNIGDDLKIFSYDLRFSNLCNLACIGCMPQQSSLWAKELKIDYPAIPTKFKIEETINAKYIYLAGGEPFLAPETTELLEAITKTKKQPIICINTNLTVQDDYIKELCSKLNGLTLCVSIDGINSVAEYHRWPIKWEKFLRNLEWAKTLNCDIMFHTVIDAVNVSFIHEIMEYENYTDKWTLTLLMRPLGLQVKNLPDSLKNFAYQNFIKLRDSKHYKNNEIFKNSVEQIAQEIMLEGNSKNLSSFISALDKRRNINHTDYLGIQLT
jgi:sulfatase maturation enzyme AslB (radical SAM superfamily)